ncbi:Os08g0448900, partial [Oryza sativa Japonica Group]
SVNYIFFAGISKLLRLLLKTDKYERLKRRLISSSILDELSVS